MHCFPLNWRQFNISIYKVAYRTCQVNILTSNKDAMNEMTECKKITLSPCTAQIMSSEAMYMYLYHRKQSILYCIRCMVTCCYLLRINWDQQHYICSLICVSCSMCCQLSSLTPCAKHMSLDLPIILVCDNGWNIIGIQYLTDIVSCLVMYRG